MTNLATIGHNNPPTETEILKLRLAEYKSEAEQYEKLASKELPALIETDEKAGELTDHISFIKKLKSTIGDIHKKEKQPFWDAGKAADTWKNEFEAKLDSLIKKTEPLLMAWNKKKEAEEVERQKEIAAKALAASEALAKQAEAHADEGIMDTANSLMDAAINQEAKAGAILNSSMNVHVKSRGSWGTSSIKKTWTAEIESLPAIDCQALLPYFTEEDLLKAANRAVKDGLRKIRGFKVYEKEQLSTR